MSTSASETVRDAPSAEGVFDRLGARERPPGTLGNRSLTRLLARAESGTGILPSGLVHPDIQAAIAAARGAGTPLTGGVWRHLESAYEAPLRDVRVHADEPAAALARAVSARAFTVSSDIVFAGGEYDPVSRGGRELIAHEVAHVVRQRGASGAGQLSVSQPGDASEREAEAMARDATS